MTGKQQPDEGREREIQCVVMSTVRKQAEVVAIRSEWLRSDEAASSFVPSVGVEGVAPVPLVPDVLHTIDTATHPPLADC